MLGEEIKFEKRIMVWGIYLNKVHQRNDTMLHFLLLKPIFISFNLKNENNLKNKLKTDRCVINVDIISCLYQLQLKKK